jgi:hypothetical protein
MSVIIPAGNNKINWSPKQEDKLQKTASTDGSVAEESNPLYEAAKKYIAAQSEVNVDETEDKDGLEIEVKNIEDVSEVEVELEDSACEKIDDAVEKLEEVVADLKGEDDKSEVSEEVAVDEKKDEEVEIEVEVNDEKEVLDIPGKDVSNSEIIVESSPDEVKEDKEACMDKSASTEEEFCRFAKLSPVNKKKLADYWVNALGYPKDFVNLMVKDYEK